MLMTRYLIGTAPGVSDYVWPPAAGAGTASSQNPSNGGQQASRGRAVPSPLMHTHCYVTWAALARPSLPREDTSVAPP